MEIRAGLDLEQRCAPPDGEPQSRERRLCRRAVEELTNRVPAARAAMPIAAHLDGVDRVAHRQHRGNEQVANRGELRIDARRLERPVHAATLGSLHLIHELDDWKPRTLIR